MSMTDAQLRTYVAKQIRAHARNIAGVADLIDGDTKISDEEASRARDMADTVTINLEIIFPKGFRR